MDIFFKFNIRNISKIKKIPIKLGFILRSQINKNIFNYKFQKMNKILKVKDAR